MHERTQYSSAVDKYWYFKNEAKARAQFAAQCERWKHCRLTDCDDEYLDDDDDNDDDTNIVFKKFVRRGFLPLGNGDFVSLDEVSVS